MNTNNLTTNHLTTFLKGWVFAFRRLMAKIKILGKVYLSMRYFIGCGIKMLSGMVCRVYLSMRYGGYGLCYIVLLVGMILVPISVESVTTDAMIVYSELNSRPVYRRFIRETTTWSSPSEANDVSDVNVPGSGGIVWMRIVSAPRWTDRPNEKVLVTLDTLGRLKGQVWNGMEWSSPHLISADLARDGLYKRGFDVAYSSNIVFVVFNRNESADFNQLGYVTWNGTDWSGTTNFGYDGHGGKVRWVQLASRPGVGQYELAIAVADSADDINYGRLTAPHPSPAWAWQGPAHQITLSTTVVQCL